MRVIRITIGGFFILLGIVWASLNRFSCNRLCSSCAYEQLAPCYFLFLFVGIIFIVSGASLILAASKKQE